MRKPLVQVKLENGEMGFRLEVDLIKLAPHIEQTIVALHCHPQNRD